MRKTKNNILYILAVIIFLFFTLAPIIWLLSMSLTHDTDLLSKGVDIFPESLYLENYKDILNPASKSHHTLFGGIKNSLISAFFTLLVGLPTSVLAAYAFYRYNFRSRKMMITALLFTIVIPVFTTLVPIYAMFARLHLLDNLPAMSIIYVSSVLPITTRMIMNYLDSMPKELWEAGELDGCTEQQLFIKLILPLMRPILISSGLIIILNSWSQYQIPLILTNTQNNKVATLVLSEFITRDAISHGMIAACGVIIILPPAIVAVIFRKLLVNGMVDGAVKA